MTKAQFRSHFDLALTQYDTIDRPKCERIGPLLQGFVGVKNVEDAHIIPFSCTESHPNRLADDIWILAKDLIIKSDFIGVSFVQHYIHYT